MASQTQMGTDAATVSSSSKNDGVLQGSPDCLELSLDSAVDAEISRMLTPQAQKQLSATNGGAGERDLDEEIQELLQEIESHGGSAAASAKGAAGLKKHSADSHLENRSAKLPSSEEAAAAELKPGAVPLALPQSVPAFNSFAAGSDDPSRPSTAQVEQLILSEGLHAQTDPLSLEEMGDNDPLECSQSSDRPNTALAEQLVSEEIAGRKSLTNSKESCFGLPLHALRESSMSPRGESGHVSPTSPLSPGAGRLLSDSFVVASSSQGGYASDPSASATGSSKGLARVYALSQNPHTGRLDLVEEMQKRPEVPDLLESFNDQARPSTAQADRLIHEEFQWQNLGEAEQATQQTSTEDLLRSLSNDPTRPSTAQAEQLVLEEMAGRHGNGGREGQSANDSEGGWWKSMVGPWFESTPSVDVTRPSTAQVEQLVAEEINARRPVAHQSSAQLQETVSAASSDILGNLNEH